MTSDAVSGERMLQAFVARSVAEIIEDAADAECSQEAGQIFLRAMQTIAEDAPLDTDTSRRLTDAALHQLLTLCENQDPDFGELALKALLQHRSLYRGFRPGVHRRIMQHHMLKKLFSIRRIISDRAPTRLSVGSKERRDQTEEKRELRRERDRTFRAHARGK